MSVGSVAFNDPLHAFYKAVDAARQRNTTAFAEIRPAARLEKPAELAKKGPNGIASANQPNEKRPAGARGAPARTDLVQSPQKPKTRILGNFFDAYA